MARSVRGRLRRVKDRSVMELIVLALTAVVALILLGSAFAVAIIEVRDPQVDTSGATERLTNIVVAILGVLLGLLTGRSERVSRLDRRPEEEAEYEARSRPKKDPDAVE